MLSDQPFTIIVGEHTVTFKDKAMRNIEKHYPALGFASRILGISALIFLCLFLFGHHEQAIYAAGVLGCTTLSILFDIMRSHQAPSEPPIRKDSAE